MNDISTTGYVIIIISGQDTLLMYGVVWRGAVRCGVVRRSPAWCSAVWCSAARCGVVRRGVVLLTKKSTG